MKVQIIKSTNRDWYALFIGETYSVYDGERIGRPDVYILDDTNGDNIAYQYVKKEDAVIVFPPDAYQMLALETWHNKDVPKNEQINHAILQLAAECGEVVKIWAKHLYKPAHEITRDKVLDELGDLWYYVRIVAFLHDITIDELTEFNHQKLIGGHGWNGSSEKVNKRINTNCNHDNQSGPVCSECGQLLW